MFKSIYCLPLHVSHVTGQLSLTFPCSAGQFGLLFHRSSQCCFNSEQSLRPDIKPQNGILSLHAKIYNQIWIYWAFIQVILITLLKTTFIILQLIMIVIRTAKSISLAPLIGIQTCTLLGTISNGSIYIAYWKFQNNKKNKKWSGSNVNCVKKQK